MIAILGARGSIGQATRAALARNGRHAGVRLGTRSATADPAWVTVDEGSPSSLATFAQGCSVVVDCTGICAPTTVAAALDAGASYLTPSSPTGLLSGHEVPDGLTACCNVGSAPGLSAVLQTYAARDLGTASELLFAYHVQGPLSLASAQALARGVVCATRPGRWEEGAYARERTSAPVYDLDPLFGSAALYAGVDDEARWVAQTLGLRSARWLTGMGGAQVAQVLPLLGTTYLRDPRAAAHLLRDAFARDTCTEPSGVRYLVRVRNDQGDSVTLRATATDPSALTGATLAACALMIDEGSLAPLATRVLGDARSVPGLVERLVASGALDLTRTVEQHTAPPQSASGSSAHGV